jgi:hypothetical protein
MQGSHIACKEVEESFVDCKEVKASNAACKEAEESFGGRKEVEERSVACNKELVNLHAKKLSCLQWKQKQGVLLAEK